MERYRGTTYPEDGPDDPTYDGLYVFCDDWGTDPQGEPYYETKRGCWNETWMELWMRLEPGDTITKIADNSVLLR